MTGCMHHLLIYFLLADKKKAHNISILRKIPCANGDMAFIKKFIFPRL